MTSAAGEAHRVGEEHALPLPDYVSGGIRANDCLYWLGPVIKLFAESGRTLQTICRGTGRKILSRLSKVFLSL